MCLRDRGHQRRPLLHLGAVPCIVSSASAYALALVMGVAPEHFFVENVPAFDISTMWRVLVIAILCAVASMLFCWAMHSGAKLFKKLFKNEFLRAAVGGIVVILLTLLGRYARV